MRNFLLLLTLFVFASCSNGIKKVMPDSDETPESGEIVEEADDSENREKTDDSTVAKNSLQMTVNLNFMMTQSSRKVICLKSLMNTKTTILKRMMPNILSAVMPLTVQTAAPPTATPLMTAAKAMSVSQPMPATGGKFAGMLFSRKILIPMSPEIFQMKNGL